MNQSTPHTPRSWTVEILLDERDGRTHAEARLHTQDATHLVGRGQTWLNPRDRDVPEIGDEIATARALSELAHVLLEAAADDIAGVTHQDVRLPM